MPHLPITHVATLPLKYNGDCSLIGVTPDRMIYAEEVHGDEGRVAQHALRFDGTFVETIDERDDGSDIQPLVLPPEIVKPKTGWQTMTLNFAGPRHRGMREPERTVDLVQTLGIEEKMMIAERLKLGIAPPQLLGIADSYVLAEARIVRPALYFVCRRVRLTIALSEARLDDDGQPYDYDTHVIYLAHFYDCNEELRLRDCFADLTGVPLYRPMDCLLMGDHLFIADGGSADRPSAIHVWQVELPEVLSEEEKLRRKIYG
jgi:hypothetical protein